MQHTGLANALRRPEGLAHKYTAWPLVLDGVLRCVTEDKPAPLCRQCHVLMVKKHSTNAYGSGEFWGCPNYPHCIEVLCDGGHRWAAGGHSPVDGSHGTQGTA